MRDNPAIGGYFELELGNQSTLFHESALAVNSGRNALELILRNHRFKRIHLPVYGCEALYQTARKTGVEIVFYTMDETFEPQSIELETGDVLLYINYFGVLQSRVDRLTKQALPLIIDNCQAFFSEHGNELASFYSARKFLGVPDGGYVYDSRMETVPMNLETDHSYHRLTHLVRRLDENPEAGYDDYKRHENAFSDLPLKRMSLLTRRMLSNIDYEKVRERRNRNFIHLHNRLRFDNELTALIGESALNGPMVYPYLHVSNDDMRDDFQRKRIFIARYWPSMGPMKSGHHLFESHLQRNLLALPIDQRYTENDMEQILAVLKK